MSEHEPKPNAGEAQKTYQFTEIIGGGDQGILIRTTDKKTVEDLYSELKKIIPQAKKMEIGTRPIEGLEQGILRIYNLQSQDGSVQTWLIKRLGEKSWEPFAARPNFVGFRKTLVSGKETE